MLRYQRFIGAADQIQIQQFRPHGARNLLPRSVFFRILRGDLAFPQLVHRLTDPLHSPRQIRHVLIEPHLPVGFLHRPVHRHQLPGLAEHPATAAAGLLLHEHPQLLRADDIQVQQALQVQIRDQVPLRLQRHLFRHIQQNPALLQAEIPDIVQQDRPRAAAPSCLNQNCLHPSRFLRLLYSSLSGNYSREAFFCHEKRAGAAAPAPRIRITDR